MGSYNMLKEQLKSHGIAQTTISTFSIGAVAGVITVYATQPFDTIKTMSQTVSGSGSWAAVNHLVRTEGIRGFWKGSTMRLGRLIFSGGIVFTVYENISYVLMAGTKTRAVI
jgi:solute carrier family 25 (mitochondrial citrate transporter), member 1